MAMICSSLCRVPFIAVLLSWVGENSHSRRSSFRGLGHLRGGENPEANKCRVVVYIRSDTDDRKIVKHRRIQSNHSGQDQSLESRCRNRQGSDNDSEIDETDHNSPHIRDVSHLCLPYAKISFTFSRTCSLRLGFKYRMVLSMSEWPSHCCTVRRSTPAHKHRVANVARNL